MANASKVKAPVISNEGIHIVDDPSFNKKNVAIVTGAGSGIGQATAIALAANGLTVTATDINEIGLDETSRMGEKLDVEGTIHTIPGDVTEYDDIEKIVAGSEDHGDIKYLANIAGLQHIDPIEDFPVDQYDALTGVMLRAPFLLSKSVIPRIRRSNDGTGCIGNMSSVHGRYVEKGMVAHNISKFGIRGLTQSIAAEGEGNVRAFSVSTGFVKTPPIIDSIEGIVEEQNMSVAEAIEDVMLDQSRVKEMMEPIDVANLFTVGFSYLGQHLNGADLLWDGGMALTYK